MNIARPLRRFRRAARESAALSAYRPLLVIFGVTVFALLISLIYCWRSPSILDADAMDAAQIARSISSGHGLTTQIVRPITLPILTDQPNVPDLTNPPLYSFVLGLVFAMTSSRDRVVIDTAAVLFALSAGMLTALSYRILKDIGMAVLSGLIFSLTPPLLTMTHEGSPLLLTTALALALLLILTPRNPEHEPSDSQMFKLYMLAGAVTGLCYLSDYTSPLFTIPLTVIWTRTLGRWGRLAVLGFLLGGGAVVAPWLIRNFRLTGNPLYSTQWFGFAANTSDFPGSSLYRSLDAAPLSGLALKAPRLGPFIMKLARGLVHFYDSLAGFPDLYLTPFVVVAYWFRSEVRLVTTAKWGVLLSLVAAVVGSSALGRVSLAEIAPLAAVLILIGVGTFQDLSAEAARRWAQRRANATAGWLMRAGGPDAFRGLLSAGLLLVIATPFIWQTVVSPSREQTDFAEAAAKLKKALPPNGAIVTDVPWLVAWYTNREAIWLPGHAAQLSDVEKKRHVSGIYLTQNVMNLGPEEKLGEWQRAYQIGFDFPGFDKTAVPSAGSAAYIYKKRASLSDVEKSATAHPSDAASQFDLGRTLAQKGDLDAALKAFATASRLAPDLPGPLGGEGWVYLHQKNYKAAEDAYTRMLKLTPHALEGERGLASAYALSGDGPDAIQAYEKTLADYPNDLVAVNNLADLYAESNRNLDRATEMARRAAAGNPNDGAIRDTLGWVLFRQGRLKEAVQQLMAAAKLAPDNVMAQYHLGKAILAGHPADKQVQAQAYEVLRGALARGLPTEQAKDARSLLPTY